MQYDYQCKLDAYIKNHIAIFMIDYAKFYEAGSL